MVVVSPSSSNPASLRGGALTGATAFAGLAAIEIAVLVALAMRVPASAWAAPAAALSPVVEALLLRNLGARWLGVVIALLLWRRRALERLLAEPTAPPRERRLVAPLAVHVAAFACAAASVVLAPAHPTRALASAGVVSAAAALASLAFSFLLAQRPLAVWRQVASLAWAPALCGIAVAEIGDLAGAVTSLLWRELARPTFALVEIFTRLLVPDVLVDPVHHRIRASGFSVVIAPACSGYEGVGLLLTVLGAYLFVFRAKLHVRRALVLLPLGALLVWVLNAVRIALLVYVGSRWSSSVALTGFHSQMGWLLFVSVALGLVLTCHRSAFFSRSEARAAIDTPGERAAPYVGPFVALTATAMVTGAMSAGFDALYPARVVVVAAVLAWSWPARARARWTPAWTPIAIGALVYALWLVLEPSAADTQPRALAEMAPAARCAWLACRVAGAVVTVPLAEELAFRGFLARRIQVPAGSTWSTAPARFTWVSFLVSSFAFGLLHHRWVAGVAAGMLYAAATYRRGALADAVVAHAATNALLAAHVLVLGRWSLWA